MYILKYMDIILRNISVTKSKGIHFMVFQNHPKHSTEGRLLSTRQTRWGTRLILCLLVLGMVSTFSFAHAALAATPTTPVNGTSQTLNTTSGQPALGSSWQPIKATGAAAKAGSVVPGQVLLQLASGTTLTASGGPRPQRPSPQPKTAPQPPPRPPPRPPYPSVVLRHNYTPGPHA